MVDKMQKVEIEPLIWLLNPPVGDMLKAIAQFKLFMFTEQNTKTDMIGKLKCTAQTTIPIH